MLQGLSLGLGTPTKEHDSNAYFQVLRLQTFWSKNGKKIDSR